MLARHRRSTCRATTSGHRTSSAARPAASRAVVSLNLSGNAIGDAGLIALTVADWLPNLRELHLNANGITDEASSRWWIRRCSARLRVFHVTDNALRHRGDAGR